MESPTRQTEPLPVARETRNDGSPRSEEFPRDLRDPSLFINRELSLLEFNRRVLAQAQDPSVPLLERLRFLTICSTNLDEVFEIRVGSLEEQIRLGLDGAGPDGMTPRETLARVHETAHDLVAEQYRTWSDDIMPALAAEGVRVVFRRDWTDAVRAWAARVFEDEVLPVMTPVGLDPAHPLPEILNKSLNFAVSLEGRDAFGRPVSMAVVQAPRPLPRLMRVPRSVHAGPGEVFVTLSGIIHDNVARLFPGMTIRGCHPFRLTRNSDLWVDEEEIEDLLRALKGRLPRRHFGEAVRLEVDAHCPPDMAAFLLRQFQLEPQALYRVNGPVNIYRLAMLYDLVDRPDLKYRPFEQGIPAALARSSDPFAVIRRGDVLLHHPYESFRPVVDLIERAAGDPNVLAIKMTMYRTGADSPLVDALAAAARAGKEVTAVVELRARFDEATNIDIATRLRQAGAKVVYGIVRYKAHAKILLIVRREADGIRRYVHLGTGNYHLGNTRAYTDFGLLTADPDVGADAHDVFLQLTGLCRVPRHRRLLQAPFTLHARILELIEREATDARAGRPAWIRAKMNALIEPRVIEALYRASRAGVRIDLIVRGICCLRPGVPGVSENIRVRSTIGRFLEHSRIFCFHAGGEEITLCSSADWMPRNFFRRVETAFPILDRELAERVRREGVLAHLTDDLQTWDLEPDGRWVRADPADPDRPRVAQRELLDELAAGD